MGVDAAAVGARHGGDEIEDGDDDQAGNVPGGDVHRAPGDKQADVSFLNGCKAVEIVF